MSLRIGIDNIFDLKSAFGSHPINVTEVRETIASNFPPDFGNVAPLDETFTMNSWNNTPIYVFLIQVLTAWLCYIFGKFACKICIQGFSFAFPVNLTIPVSISLLITMCGLKFDTACAFDFMPPYLFWECKDGNILIEFLNS